MQWRGLVIGWPVSLLPCRRVEDFMSHWLVFHGSCRFDGPTELGPPRIQRYSCMSIVLRKTSTSEQTTSSSTMAPARVPQPSTRMRARYPSSSCVSSVLKYLICSFQYAWLRLMHIQVLEKYFQEANQACARNCYKYPQGFLLQPEDELDPSDWYILCTSRRYYINDTRRLDTRNDN